ncbi:Uncharacterised protein [Mycobacteroides abscessus subsp. abscessus]|nr:Uncharacterised protein [Mycobacteroides abscessus subsp. abscessus]
MALAARHKLAEHENPGEATLLILGGLVELATSTARATFAARVRSHSARVPRTYSDRGFRGTADGGAFPTSTGSCPSSTNDSTDAL